MAKIKGMEYVKRTISSIDKRSNTPDGNPRYTVYFTDGSSGNSENDAHFVYEMNNPGMRAGDTVEVAFVPHRPHVIADMEPLTD